MLFLSAAALAGDLHDAPAVAWRYRPRGRVDAAPRLDAGRLLLATLEGTTRRGLHLLDARTGRLLAARTLVAADPLAFDLDGEHVVVRANPRRLDLLRFDGARLSTVRSLGGRRPWSAPILREGELLAREGDELLVQDLRAGGPRWRLGEGLVRGDPARAGAVAYAVRYDGRGRAELLAVDVADGAVLDRIGVGSHAGRVPSAEADLEVVAVQDAVFVRHALPVRGSNGREFDTVRVGLAAPGRFDRGDVTLHDLDGAPVSTGAHWIARGPGPDGSPRWLATESTPGSGRVVVLASTARHGELCRGTPVATLADGVVFLAGTAVDPTDFTVLWRPPGPASRAVAAGPEGVFLVRADEELLCLRPPEEEVSPARAAALALEARARDALGEPLAALAERALGIGDADLAARLAAEARDHGAGGRVLGRVELELERLARAPGSRSTGSRPSASRDPRRSAALAARERELLARPTAALVQAARSAPAGEGRLAFLRRAFELAPGDPAVEAAIRAEVPPALAEVERAAPESLLDLLDVAARRPLRSQAPPSPGAGPPWSELAGWREGARGFATERLFVVTPPGRPGTVARGLEAGEALADRLEELFAPFGRARPGAAAMTLFLYPTRADYLAGSRRARSLPETALGWSAGHYDPSQNVSRMFVPPQDAGLVRFLGVYAHELTHHWLATRAPFPVRADGEGRRPAYWIVEGFANLIEELGQGPRARSLDTVANVPADRLLPWRRVFTLSYGEFPRLSAEEKLEVALTWRLGVSARRSEIQLFYAQAGAACHYLYAAEGGRHRDALLAYVAAWYGGDARGLEVERAFGLAADELGRRARAFALAAVTGDGD